MENFRKQRDIKLVKQKKEETQKTKNKQTNYLLTEPNYHTTKFFSENVLAMEMKKTQILLNKPVYLGLSILELSKIRMYQFWYDYVKPKYGEKANLCYMDTDSFIVYIKIDDIYKDTAEDLETNFDTSNYELNRPLLKGKNKV